MNNIYRLGSEMSNTRLNTETFIEQAKEIYRDKYDYSHVHYTGVNNKIDIICPTHGLFIKVARDFLLGSHCNTCSQEKKSYEKYQNFLEQATKTHGDKYDYSKVVYLNTNIKVEIICPEHGRFLQTPNEHIDGRICPGCLELIKKEKTAGTKQKT